jgi:hypothetical protein
MILRQCHVDLETFSQERLQHLLSVHWLHEKGTVPKVKLVQSWPTVVTIYIRHTSLEVRDELKQ